MARPKGSTNKKVVASPVISQPISVKFFINDIENEVKTNNILTAFRDLKVAPHTLKTATRIIASYNDGKPFIRVLSTMRMRRLLADDMTRQIVSKQFTTALGIK